MLAEKTNKNLIRNEYLFFIGLIITNLIFMKIIGSYEEQIYRVINIPQFLTAHIVLEFFGIVISFMTYIITYYTFNKNKRMRLLIYSSTFFIAGMVSFFHIMSYDGMPVFFTKSSAPKATSFWMISRFVMAIGLFIAGTIPINKKTNMKREYFFIGSILITGGIFYIGTFHLEWLPPMFIEGQGLTGLKVLLEYLIMVIFGVTLVLYIRDYNNSGDKVFRIYSIGLCFAIFTDGAFTLYKSVYDTYNLLGHIFNIISGYLIFRSIFLHNLDHPYNQLNEARNRLKQYADNLEQVVERRSTEIHAVNKKMTEDLEYAKGIQQSLLPPKSLNIYNTRFISEYIPCEKLSGDFYNIHVVDEDHIGMYIADVSGHGVSAAMMTVFADSVMKSPDFYSRGLKNRSPGKRLDYFYREFNKSNFPNEMHIVIFEAVFNVKTKSLSYCSGGMNVVPILVRKNGETEMLDKSVGFPICKFGDFYNPKYENAHITLSSGDRIIFYTDGLVEYFKENTLLRKELLISILEENREEELELLNKKILFEIRKNTTEDYLCDDDITYFILEA